MDKVLTKVQNFFTVTATRGGKVIPPKAAAVKQAPNTPPKAGQKKLPEKAPAKAPAKAGPSKKDGLMAEYAAIKEQISKLKSLHKAEKDKLKVKFEKELEKLVAKANKIRQTLEEKHGVSFRGRPSGSKNVEKKSTSKPAVKTPFSHPTIKFGAPSARRSRISSSLDDKITSLKDSNKRMPML